MLERIRKSGVTVFVSTPYMDEASLCDRLAMIRGGEIIGTGTPEQIISAYPYRLLSVEGDRIYPLLKRLRETEGVISCFSFGASLHLAYDPEKTEASGILAAIRESGLEDCKVKEISPGIEDCFMQLARK